MSDYIDTREGWREVSSHAFATACGPRLREDPSPEDNGLSRYWVREAPVPPLPTAPYTVIRVTWIEDADDDLVDLWVRGDEQWSAVEQGQWGTPDWLNRSITSFEVLSEPRAVTAKAVLDHIGSEPWARDTDLSHWRRVFGVES